MRSLVRAGRCIAKGDSKYLVLSVLREKPMHGYEVMKSLAARSSGLYTPSPGVVYPALRALEDLGCVKVVREDGRKVYAITNDGLRSLEDWKAERVPFKFGSELLGKERAELFHQLRSFGKLLFTTFPELTPEKAERVRQVVSKAEVEVRRIVIE